MLVAPCSAAARNPRRSSLVLLRLCVRLSIVVALFFGVALPVPVRAEPPTLTQIDIVGPAGSGAFGAKVVVLPNGNFVVTDPNFAISQDRPEVGAVYLYNGTTLGLISRLTGSASQDHVGGGGIVALANGNYVVVSPDWDNGAIADAGAVTWVNAATGITGTVSAGNSLVGGSTNDRIGDLGPPYSPTQSITVLTNGNYVVSSPNWDNGAAVDAGAASWVNGATGLTGIVSAANSLVGGTAGDHIGYVKHGYDPQMGIYVLTNSNYVVSSPNWDNGAAADAGAITWANGMTGRTGTVSPINSLVGSRMHDCIGASWLEPWGLECELGDKDFVTMLPNGNYVVRSPFWDNGAAANAGAATWGSGTAGVVGALSAANSLVGTAAEDQVGGGGVTSLPSGNYVVNSFLWNNGAVVDAGAVTWGNGATGIAGAITAVSSLVGSRTEDRIGSHFGYSDYEASITVLTNGNYVVPSTTWDNGTATNVGAATWGNGTTGVSGAVSEANSLVGTTANDSVGDVFRAQGIVALANGNYVVASTYWDNGAVVDVGAVTWCNGATGRVGVVSPTNSLFGSTEDAVVAYLGVTPLTNGNYVVKSPLWKNEFAVSIGAATWGNGATGTTGAVSATNSLVGTMSDEKVGERVEALPNGNYVVESPAFEWGDAWEAGAVTWGNGATGTSGDVSIANSLVGSSAYEWVGLRKVLASGAYLAGSTRWTYPTLAEAGAISWCDGVSSCSGIISPANSLVGSTAGDRVSILAALPNGDYVAGSPNWSNGSTSGVGAATWCSGTAGITGTVSAANSLVGSTTSDGVGEVTALVDGTYLVRSPGWDNGAMTDVGAISWSTGPQGLVGTVAPPASVIGTTAGGGQGMFAVHDAANNRLFVGRPADNRVTILQLKVPIQVFIPKVMR